MTVAAKDLNWRETIHLAPGTRPAALPHEVNVENAVGFYHAHYTSTGDVVQVERRFVLNRSVFQPQDVAAVEGLIYAALDDVRATVSVAPMKP